MNRQKGYTLVELVVVIGIILFLALLLLPATGRVRDESSLAEAAEILTRQLLNARMESLAKGRVTEVRLLKNAQGEWFGVQTVSYLSGGGEERLTGVESFPVRVLLEESPGGSPLLDELPSGTADVTPYGSLDWRGIRFTPSGEIAGNAASGVAPENSYLSLVLKREMNPARSAGEAMPDNYATVQVMSSTGRVSLYRP